MFTWRWNDPEIPAEKTCFFWLVVGFNPSEKYDFVIWDDNRNPIYGKIKNGNQTTNKMFFCFGIWTSFFRSCFWEMGGNGWKWMEIGHFAALQPSGSWWSPPSLRLQTSTLLAGFNPHLSSQNGQQRRIQIAGNGETAGNWTPWYLEVKTQQIDNRYPPRPSIAGWWFEALWKIWKSIGMISNPIYGKIKNGNQTTNQIDCGTCGDLILESAEENTLQAVECGNNRRRKSTEINLPKAYPKEWKGMACQFHSQTSDYNFFKNPFANDISRHSGSKHPGLSVPYGT